MNTFIIAEAGVNHNGSLDLAKKLIDAAVDASADAVKFQTFKANRIVTATAAKAGYQTKNVNKDEPQIEMLKRLELSADMHKELFSYCREKRIMFMSTPFDEESADLLEALGMSIYKISSGEITNRSLIRHIASKKKEIILSTGMSYLGEVEKAVNWINEIWDGFDKKPRLTLLHCTSNYPAAAMDTNLLAMKAMEKAFGLPTGYSDHTMGTEISVAAVALGACLIEKHFTLDRNMEGPDHKASLEHDELKALVKAIRNVEKALGDGVKRPSKNEEDTRIATRRSLITSRNMKAGDTITADDIVIKRPGTGIPPEFKEIIIGMRVKNDMIFDTVINWENLKNA